MEDDAQRISDWDASLDEASYYELLSVSEMADEATIRRAFRCFALAFHPDMHSGASAETLAAVRRIFQSGAEAYRVLCDPELRLRYDVQLSKGRLRLDPGELQKAQDESSARALDALCRSAGAKLCAQRAAKLIDAGDLSGAMRELKLALAHDGNANPALAERIDALEIALYAMGS